MGRCFAKHSMTSSKVCSSVRTGAIAGVFTYATSKQMLSMVGGSLNLRRLKFKAIRDGIPLWRKLFDLLRLAALLLVWPIAGQALPSGRQHDGITLSLLLRLFPRLHGLLHRWVCESS